MNRKVLVAGMAVAVPLLAVLILNIGRNPATIRSPLIGRAAPPFTLAPVGGGEPVSLARFKGRPVVLNFWATWCVPCHQEHPVLVAHARALGDAVQFLGVVYQDDEENVVEWLRRRGSAYPSLLDPDGKTAIAYGVYGVPETYFIDATGTIVSKHLGPLDDRTLQGYLEHLRGAAP